MNNSKLSIKKIPVKQLIDTLVKLYEEGVDFIDLTGAEVSKTKDSLSIGISKDYYNPEFREVEEEKQECTQVLLTQEDINNLL